VRFIFKTSYYQDLGLFQDRVERNWYFVLAIVLLMTPLVIPAYLSDLSLMLIFGLCGVSLMVLVGYTGVVSLGHAAFLGIGAYAHVYFSQDMGLPWVVSVVLAAAVTAAAGVLVGLPVLRLSGLYLAIATLAFALIIQEVFSRWDSVTGGIKGKAVERAVIFGYPINEGTFYFLCLGFLIAALWFYPEPLARARRARPHRNPRQRNCRAIDGSKSDLLQDLGFWLLSRDDGVCRSAVRAQDWISCARYIHRPVVDSIPSNGRRWWAWQSSRRHLRRDVRRTFAGADLVRS
jgi:hypothetical protein